MSGHGADGNAPEDLDSFKDRVREEIGTERTMLERVRAPRRGDFLGHILTLVLMSLLITLVLIDSDVFFLWFIIALLLYSYNFIIILIPTTTEKIRPGDSESVKDIDRERRWLAIKLLAKKPRLAVEIGLTVFLGGMVPLALSFTVIFGLTLAFVVYFGIIVHLIAEKIVWTVVVQVVFILFFYLMIVLLEPQTQGLTRIASSYKGRYGIARTEGRTAVLIITMTITVIILVASLLTLGAILLPGSTLIELLANLSAMTWGEVAMIIIVTICLLVTMRHLQGVASRRMAINILEHRLERLQNEVQTPLENISSIEGQTDQERLVALKRIFYSIVIYDVLEHDFFGRSPIYMVGPRLRYVLDDQVIATLA